MINDAFSLAEATLLSYDIALDLTSYLTNETEYVPWSVASTNLLSLKNQLYHTPQFSKFSVSRRPASSNASKSKKHKKKFCLQKFGQSVISAVYEEVGWTVNEDHLRKYDTTKLIQKSMEQTHRIFFLFFSSVAVNCAQPF